MNYTLLAYVVSILLLLWVAIHPASHVVVLREESREEALITMYWLVVNSLASQDFQTTLESQYRLLDQRIAPVPDRVVVDYYVQEEYHKEARVRVHYSWGWEEVYVLLKVEVLERSERRDPVLGLVKYVKLRVSTDTPTLYEFRAERIVGEKRYVDGTVEVEYTGVLVFEDSRGFTITIG